MKVNAEKCIHCGRCVRKCPLHCIKFDSNNIPVINEACSDCRKCASICPAGAIE